VSVGTKRVLVVIGGGVAPHKTLHPIPRLKERGGAVRCFITKAAGEFFKPPFGNGLLGGGGFPHPFAPAGAVFVGHILLPPARERDLIVVAPATADLMAKLAGGHAGDLATAVLLATTAKILLAPAMNPRMWANRATQRNLTQLVADGVVLVGPDEGEMAEPG